MICPLCGEKMDFYTFEGTKDGKRYFIDYANCKTPSEMLTYKYIDFERVNFVCNNHDFPIHAIYEANKNDINAMFSKEFIDAIEKDKGCRIFYSMNSQ